MNENQSPEEPKDPEQNDDNGHESADKDAQDKREDALGEVERDVEDMLNRARAEGKRHQNVPPVGPTHPNYGFDDIMEESKRLAPEPPEDTPPLGKGARLPKGGPKPPENTRDTDSKPNTNTNGPKGPVQGQ